MKSEFTRKKNNLHLCYDKAGKTQSDHQLVDSHRVRLNLFDQTLSLLDFCSVNTIDCSGPL